MDITGLTLTRFRACALLISAERYDGNVIIHGDAHDRDSQKNGTPQCTARLAVRDSRGPGSRTSARGRHGPYACWHAYRDVLAEVFRRYPGAVIRSGHGWRVTYRGASGFAELYPETAHVMIGSAAYPVTMPELCECEPSATEFPRGTPTYNPVPAGYEHYTEADFEADAFGAEATETAEEYRHQRDAREQDDRWSRYNNPSYISPAVQRAARVHDAIERLLSSDKAADPWVFGPEDGPSQNASW